MKMRLELYSGFVATLLLSNYRRYGLGAVAAAFRELR
jgi:hypothetical protein